MLLLDGDVIDLDTRKFFLGDIQAKLDKIYNQHSSFPSRKSQTMIILCRSDSSFT